MLDLYIYICIVHRFYVGDEVMRWFQRATSRAMHEHKGKRVPGIPLDPLRIYLDAAHSKHGSISSITGEPSAHQTSSTLLWTQT